MLFGDREHVTNETPVSLLSQSPPPACSHRLRTPTMPWKPRCGPTFRVVSLAKVCDFRINDAASDDHRAVLEAVTNPTRTPTNSPTASDYETQTAYIKARDGGQRVAFCKDFIAANSQYAKALASPPWSRTT